MKIQLASSNPAPGDAAAPTPRTRAVVCHKTWTLQPDREPDAEPITYPMQCAVCIETSPTGTDFTEPQDWVLAHGGQNPSHHTYREIITRPWRAWWNREEPNAASLELPLRADQPPEPLGQVERRPERGTTPSPPNLKEEQ